jgi:hypothetical protein
VRCHIIRGENKQRRQRRRKSIGKYNQEESKTEQTASRKLDKYQKVVGTLV